MAKGLVAINSESWVAMVKGRLPEPHRQEGRTSCMIKDRKIIYVMVEFARLDANRDQFLVVETTWMI